MLTFLGKLWADLPGHSLRYDLFREVRQNNARELDFFFSPPIDSRMPFTRLLAVKKYLK